MSCLLEEDFRSILTMRLVCLSQDRVERLGKELVVELPAEVVRHDKLQSFDRIRRLRRPIHVDWES